MPSRTEIPLATAPVVERGRFLAFLELARAIGAEVDPGVGLRRTVEGLLELFPGGQRSALYLDAGAGASDDWASSPAWQAARPGSPPAGPLSRTIAAELLRRGDVMFCRDAAADPAFDRATSLDGAGTHSFLAAPLPVGAGSRGGVLYLDGLAGGSGAPPGGDEDLLLFDAVASLVSGLVERTHLAREAIGKELLEQELRHAGKIQRGFLPRAIPPIPGWEVAAFFQPHARVGGDFYDVRSDLAGGGIALVGDVSGKGVPAALRMAELVTIFRDTILQGADAAIGAMNRAFASEGSSGEFATTQLIELDPGGTVRLHSSGHLDPIRSRRGQWHPVPLGQARPPLGVLAELADAPPVEIALEPGDALLVFTDGVLEAHPPGERGLALGYDGIRSLLPAPRADPESLLATLLEGVLVHTRSTPSDDLTVLALRYGPARGSDGRSARTQVPGT